MFKYLNLSASNAVDCEYKNKLPNMIVIDNVFDSASVNAYSSSPVTMKTARTEDGINQIIKEYLQRHFMPDYSTSWIVKSSELGGFGVFANRDIDAGEIIFIDHPVILGPRAGIREANFCIHCLSKEKQLTSCEKKCGLKVCSPECQQSDSHQKDCKVISQWMNSDSNLEEISKKMTKCLAPIRSLLLSNEDKIVVQHLKAHRGRHHGFEVQVMKEEMKLNIKEDEEEFMRFVCSVLDANAFEVVTSNDNNPSLLRGLYPLGGLANHCCVPNTFHVFDKDRRIVVRASVFIPEGQEIFHCYTRIIWSTLTRRYHLHRTKHFLCKCKRCSDPSELQSYICALRCVKCGGNVVPTDTLKLRTKWQCENCKVIVDEMSVSTKMSILGSILDTFSDADVDFILNFMSNKIPPLVAHNNQVVLETEYKLIWILGYSENFKWPALSAELLAMKEQMCKHILWVLETLGTGWSKMRGLMLYEVYCCMLWKKTLNKQQISEESHTSEIKAYLFEAAEILRFDVGAPDEIKLFWQNRINLAE